MSILSARPPENTSRLFFVRPHTLQGVAGAAKLTDLFVRLEGRTGPQAKSEDGFWIEFPSRPSAERFKSAAEEFGLTILELH